jgi:F-type H+-transporting ATPase subunit epsilon
MSTLHVDIITPEIVKFAGAADSIQLPGLDGQFGVLKDHTPLVAMLDAGDANIHTGSTTQRVVIGKGFATVFENRVVCLVDAAIDVDQIKAPEAQARIAEIDRAHQEHGKLSESLQAERDYLQAQLHAVSR